MKQNDLGAKEETVYKTIYTKLSLTFQVATVNEFRNCLSLVICQLANFDALIFIIRILSYSKN